jgi:hypothetical protein
MPKPSATTAICTSQADTKVKKGKAQAADETNNPILEVGGEHAHSPLLLDPAPLPKAREKAKARTPSDATKASPLIDHTPVIAHKPLATPANPQKPVVIVVAIILPATVGRGRTKRRKMP